MVCGDQPEGAVCDLQGFGMNPDRRVPSRQRMNQAIDRAEVYLSVDRRVKRGCRLLPWHIWAWPAGSPVSQNGTVKRELKRLTFSCPGSPNIPFSLMTHTRTLICVVSWKSPLQPQGLLNWYQIKIKTPNRTQKSPRERYQGSDDLHPFRVFPAR